ncbi:MAG: thiol protease/hemagglutinin PrtT [Bacteroidetes bacterium]|nr:thiol protease/hemagglutinin PrtT [Bacteroidota bacterium]
MILNKTKYLAAGAVLLTSLASAKPVAPKMAQRVAQNFYTQNSQVGLRTLNLVYTGLTSAGASAYYAFNVNEGDGFVIVSADDAAQPVIGYATTNRFVVPEAGTTISNWLSTRSKEIDFIQKNNLIPSGENAVLWLKYLQNKPSVYRTFAGGSAPSSVAPLVQTTWNQSPYYNAMCPHNSVTGCVATAMAQIMRYWSYPAQGTGSSSYCDCSSSGFSNNYGTLSANYGAATYNWANMPLSVTSANSDVALINYHCGVSVNMDYSPSGSGAWVITGDNPVCAQNSYVQYFKYNPNTIQGLYRSNYTDSAWFALLKNDLNIGRPIQYVGDDPVQHDGHTWVCDGYDANNFFHMNWGWGGFDNGWFLLSNLQTTNGGFNPSVGHEAVIGIVPIASYSLDAGISSVNQPTGSYCSTNFTPIVMLQNFGSDTLTSCNINYSIDNGAVQSISWSGTLITGQKATLSLASFVATAGTHTLVCYSSNPNAGVDANPSNNQSSTLFSVSAPGGVLPFTEGFENCVLAGSTVWEVSHTNSNGADWSVTSNGAATGAKSCMVNNFSNANGNLSVLQTSKSYDLTQLTNPMLSFKVAYHKKTTAANNDYLQVLTSTDCGNNWISKWVRTSASLSSGISATPYMPASSDFVTYTVNLASLSSNTSVLFKWDFMADINGVGNNIYLDDINIYDAVSSGIATIASVNAELDLYPNPSVAGSNLSINLSEQHNVSVQVCDMLGRVVEGFENKRYAAGQSIVLLNASNSYQAGIYNVVVSIDGQRVSKKMIVQ